MHAGACALTPPPPPPSQRKWYRNVLMYGFHFFVATVGGVRGVRDTQCGFKLFTREAAQRLFPSLHIERWAFDVELIMLAQKARMPVAVRDAARHSARAHAHTHSRSLVCRRCP